MKILVTGSAGLIGSEAARFFAGCGHEVHGIDNDARAVFFGPGGSTYGVRRQLQADFPDRYTHHPIDIRDGYHVMQVFGDLCPDAVIHAAGQPSHDWARENVFDDWEINATGTLRLLEAARLYCPESPFVFLSTNKVYGDSVNRQIQEESTRFEFAYGWLSGVDETCSVDQCLHSLFGCSKLAADVLVQEYGRAFGMPTCCLRCGCLTGPQHAAVSLHGFLAYLVQCAVRGERYTVYGHQGKQVRDQLHAHDVVMAIAEIINAPGPGEVYNLGGGHANSISILEAVTEVEARGHELEWEYCETPRLGDHVVYYSDTRSFKAAYPDWRVSRDLGAILDELVAAAERKWKSGRVGECGSVGVEEVKSG